MKKLLILFLFAAFISAQSFAQALMYNPWVENIVAGEDIDSISIPAWVYFSAVDGKAYLADNIVNRAQALVFAPIEADSAGQAMFSGIYEWPDSLDVGKSYYLTSTAGRTSNTRVANASTVGMAVSATRMLVAPGQLSPNGIDESIYTTNGTIPGNVARHISLDSAAAISITYPIGQPMLTLYSGDDSTCVNASVFMQSPDGDTEFLLNDANLILGRNGNYTYYTDTSITSSVTVGAVTGSFNIKADSTEITKPVVLVGDPLGTGISDGTLITRKWAEDNLSGGGGGGGDFLGTGFTSGGGSGSIPDGTVADLDGFFQFKAPDNVEVGHLQYSGNALGFDFTGMGYYNAGVGYVVSAIMPGSLGFYQNASDLGTGQVSYADFRAGYVAFSSGGEMDMRTENGENFYLTASGSLILSGSKVSMNAPMKLKDYTTSERNALSPDAGWTIFCTDCTATDSSTGVTQTYNGSTWKNHW